VIALSILVSAGHAARPLFAGRERYIAGAFGLVHGLAFASALQNLQLTAAAPLALSILGFNLGIEALQLYVIGLCFPSLLVLSAIPYYGRVRLSAAILAGIAALAWVFERITRSPNVVTAFVQALAQDPYARVDAVAAVAAAAFAAHLSSLRCA
jgi:HupE / UreJ protein